MNLLCKRITVVKSKEVKTRHNLASKEGCGSKRAVFPMMMMNDYNEAKEQYHMD
jgi:hypothetical protein